VTPLGSSPDAVSEIRRLYYESTARTIARDLARAIELLKGLASESERERAAVYMDGLSQLRSEWAAARAKPFHAAPGSPISRERPRRGTRPRKGR
jgi:hypothetical protein